MELISSSQILKVAVVCFIWIVAHACDKTVFNGTGFLSV